MSASKSMKFESERRSGLSHAEFCDRYLSANQPVVVTDALRSWKALSHWTPEFFRTTFGYVRFTVNGGEQGTAAYDASGGIEYTIAEFIDVVSRSTKDRPAPYLRNKILAEIFPALIHDVEPLPEYLFPNWLPDRYLVKYVQRVLNRAAAIEIYIGGTGGVFPVLHYDGAGTHAFLMQIYGRKQFVLYAPYQEAFLYPSPDRQNISLIDNIDNPDVGRFPMFANAVPSTFVLEPGEMLFIPSRWWHTTRMLSASISISANVVNESNWHALVDFVAMRRRNRVAALASRAYLSGAGVWRAWRDRQRGVRLNGDR